MNLSVLLFVVAAIASVRSSCQRQSDESSHACKRDVSNEANEEGSSIMYKLYTPTFKTGGRFVTASDPGPFRDAGFDSNLRTIMVIHGWLASQRPLFSGVRLKDAIYKEAQETGEYFNIILVDWSPIDTILYWVAAMRKVPVVGYENARVMRLIMRSFDYSADKFHLIGHSLGAQIAGETVRALGSKRPIITGLDPAGPLFGPDYPRRLTSKDSKNVVVIYTCAGFLSLGDSVGHTNIYPQGGRWMQPGCMWDINGVCSHCRSYLIQAEIVLNKGIKAQNCSSYTAFHNGLCNGEPVTNVYNLFPSETPRGDFYFWSNPTSPFNPSSTFGVDVEWQNVSAKIGC